MAHHEDISVKKRIRKLLSESIPQPDIKQPTRRLLTDGRTQAIQKVQSDGLMVVQSRRDEVALRHHRNPREPLFERYEDYVAYMISDDIERPQYSTFVSMDEYSAMNGNNILRESLGYSQDDEFEYDGFGSVDEYWRDSVDQILREERRQEEYSRESAKKRHQEWEERQREREWEERQRDTRQKSHTTSSSFGDSVQDRIARNKQRLLNEFGLSGTATLDDVKREYRKQMMMHHPDKISSGDAKAQEAATQKAQMLNESYHKLVKQDFL